MTPLQSFVAALGTIPVTTDARAIRTKSRDYFALSPLLMKTLKGKQAEAVVSPRSRDEVVAVAAAAHRFGIALTPRGSGTANYGQSVPLKGGAMLDLTALSEIIRIEPGRVRAKAGATIESIERAVNATGQELRFFPSTRQHATIGGFIAGGTGGIGSITWGVLRDAGNILGVEVISVEETPRIVELRESETRLVQHGYGTNGLITEVEMPLAPRQQWIEAIVACPTYAQAVALAVEIARDDRIAKKLSSAYEWPIGSWIQPFRPLVPAGQSIVIAMIAEPSWSDAAAMIAHHGGTVLTRSPQGEGVYGQPLYEFAFGHTTMAVKRTHPALTEVEGFFRSDDLLGLVNQAHKKTRAFGPMRLEVRRWEGDVVCSGSPFVDFTTEEQVSDLVRVLQECGVRVANPHASNVRGVGKKDIGPAEIAFKRSMDPKGLLNPGRFEVDSLDDMTIDKHLPTDGWLAKAG